MYIPMFALMLDGRKSRVGIQSFIGVSKIIAFEKNKSMVSHSPKGRKDIKKKKAQTQKCE